MKDSSEAVLSAFNYQFIAKKFYDLRILDSIIRSFFTDYPLEKLLNKPSTFFDRRTFLHYKFGDNKFLSTLFNTRFGLSESGETQLEIKLSNDGFKYHHRSFSEQNIYRQNRDGFYILDDELLIEMPFLASLLFEHNARALPYYSVQHSLFEIRIIRRGPPGNTSNEHNPPNDAEASNFQPFLLLAFERGSPMFVPSAEHYVCPHKAQNKHK